MSGIFYFNRHKQNLNLYAFTNIEKQMILLRLFFTLEFIVFNQINKHQITTRIIFSFSKTNTFKRRSRSDNVRELQKRTQLFSHKMTVSTSARALDFVFFALFLLIVSKHQNSTNIIGNFILFKVLFKIIFYDCNGKSFQKEKSIKHDNKNTLKNFTLTKNKKKTDYEQRSRKRNRVTSLVSFVI